MNIDDEFIKKFQSQIFLLENMEKAVKKAIGDAPQTTLQGIGEPREKC